MKGRHFFTSESVTEGHPDKLADQISDAILDSIYAQDTNGRVACETLITRGLCVVAGEITTRCYVDIPDIIRNTIKEAGYTDPLYGFDYMSCGVASSIQEQSPDIALGVDKGGAGDQGMMFGYATNETKELMPLPIMLAHKLVRRLAEVRKKELLKYLRPDGKSQVTIEYENDIPIRADAVVLSAHHDKNIKIGKIREDLENLVIDKIIPKEFLDKKTKIFINPTGRFEVGGPVADTGVTGRKIIVDTYGGLVGHGGGCFSGKDPSKVDRSGAYYARYAAKNIVAADLAEKCLIQVAYAIGVAQPVSITIKTFGTNKVPKTEIIKAVLKVFDFTPHGMIKGLNLKRPIYKKTASYGHFGRTEKEFTWELLDKVEALKKEIK